MTGLTAFDVKWRWMLISLIALTIVSVNSEVTCSAADWPQFLGPNRNGISAETGLIDKWPDGGPKEVWRVAGGVGMSGLAIKDGRLVTMLQRGGKQAVVVLDVETGKPLKEVSFAATYKNQMGNGPRATPSIVGDTAYAFSGNGILLAVGLKDGKIKWQHHVIKELGGREADYGMASSPLVVGELVIVSAGAPGANVVAYDRKSGELAWKTGNGPAGYSSPALLNVGGKAHVVAFSGDAAFGLDPKSGKQLWRFPYVTNYECNIATPISWKGRVFISSGENHGSALLNLKPTDNGFEVSTDWTSFGRTSVMRNEWQTSMLLDGHLYGLDNVGGAGPITHLNCVEVATGKRVWQEKRFGKSNLIAADGKLWFSTYDGELAIVRATPDGFDEIGRKQVLESTRQAPALANGRLYLRDDREIVCFDVRK